MSAPSPTDTAAAGDHLFVSPGAAIHVPDGLDPAQALARTTHLALVAHPDDLEFLAYHGIETCFGSPDRWFTGVVLTDGVGGPSLSDGAAERLRAERAREQRAAAEVGCYGAAVLLGHGSAAVKTPEPPASLAGDLDLILERCAPEVVYVHAPTDRHDTHVACLVHCHAALRRMVPARRPDSVLGVEGWRDLDWLTGDDRVELAVDGHPHLAAALSGLFDSQIAGGKRYDLAVAARRLAHATFADSHAPDGPSALTLAMDLTSTLADDGPDLAQVAGDAIARLGADVAQRLGRYTSP